MSDDPSAGLVSSHLKTIAHPGWLESHVTLKGPVGAEDLQHARERLPGGKSAAAIGVDLFGTEGEITEMKDIVKRAGITAPFTSVVSSFPGHGGMQFMAATGIVPAPVILHGQLCGFFIEDSGTRHCFLGGLEPSRPEAPREDQAREVFAKIEYALAHADMSFEDVVRTWFYNEKILDWYGEFNGIRTKFFEDHALRRMPASTGIGAPNPARTALVGKAVAMRSRTGKARIRPVRSPLQGDAFAYGSAFSRAIEISDPCSRTLYVSGTASIAPDGRSTRKGDPAGQIKLTMDVVRAILDEIGMGMEDTTRAIAYFRDPSHIAVWENANPIPAIALGCHICRNDLLFEIELDVSSGAARAG